MQSRRGKRLIPHNGWYVISSSLRYLKPTDTNDSQVGDVFLKNVLFVHDISKNTMQFAKLAAL